MKRVIFPTVFPSMAAAAAVFACGAVLVMGEPAPGSAAAPSGPAATANPEAGPPWLGIATKRLPRVVAEHLGLKPGTGLSVEMVVPDSPAAKAGLQKDDVLSRYGDQLLMLPEQLSTLVQSGSTGEAVALEVLRDGKPVRLEARLEGRPAEYSRQQPRQEDPLDGMSGLQDPGFEDLQAMLGGMMQGQDPADWEQGIRRMREQLEKMQQDVLQGQIKGGVHAQVFRLDQGRIQINDGQGSISIEKKDGKMTLTAKDKDGKLLYEGPYSTEEEKALVPDNIRKRADRFKFEDGALPPPAPAEPRVDGNVKPGDLVD